MNKIVVLLILATLFGFQSQANATETPTDKDAINFLNEMYNYPDISSYSSMASDDKWKGEWKRVTFASKNGYLIIKYLIRAGCDLEKEYESRHKKFKITNLSAKIRIIKSYDTAAGCDWDGAWIELYYADSGKIAIQIPAGMIGRGANHSNAHNKQLKRITNALSTILLSNGAGSNKHMFD